MNHPIVSAEHDDIPSLRLVLPGHLGRDETLAGLAGAIGEVRTGLAIRAWLCRQLEEDSTESGDRSAEALCRGQALGAEHAAAQIDEAIVAVFGLWGQYTAQVSALPERDALPAATDLAADGGTSATTCGGRSQGAARPASTIACAKSRNYTSRCPRR